MDRHALAVTKRTVMGKKLKLLRKEDILPGNVYGKGLASTPVQVSAKTFADVYKIAGGTGLVDLTIDGEKKPVLIKDVEINPLTRQILHADFYQVNLKEKITAMVPVVTVGEPIAVRDRLGLLLQTLSDVEVEALPDNLPENIEVNVEPLAAVDEQLTVAQLSTPTGVTILTDGEQVVVKISELVSEEAKEQAAADAAAQAEAKAEGAEGETTETPAAETTATPEAEKTEE